MSKYTKPEFDLIKTLLLSNSIKYLGNVLNNVQKAYKETKIDKESYYISLKLYIKCLEMLKIVLNYHDKILNSTDGVNEFFSKSYKKNNKLIDEFCKNFMYFLIYSFDF